MIRALIIDDEADARFVLAQQIERHLGRELKVVGEADDVGAGLKAIADHKPDLVFLDIKMPQGTGFDLLKQIPNVDFEVIFTTAYDQFALDAFRFSAIGYLLKPIKQEELQEVVRTHLDRMQGRLGKEDKRLKVLVENYGDDRKIKKLVVSNVNGFQIIDLENIIRLEGDRNYSRFILEGDVKILTSKRLGEYEDLLAAHGFFRVHQSTIVNLRHVKAYEKGDGGKVDMSDGHKVQLSRHRKQDFIALFV